MPNIRHLYLVALAAFATLGCACRAADNDRATAQADTCADATGAPNTCAVADDAQAETCAADSLVVGAARIEAYAPALAGKRVALYSNHTGIVAPGVHSLDVMLGAGVDVRCIFSPEHGFRGTADAGESVASSVDPASGLHIISLYGKGHKAAMEQALDSVDAVVVDIQDVGTRFYTYYCTMLELMEGAARRGLDVVVLDRPNPIGMMVDGPVLDMHYASGVGRLPIPVAHGLTLGEMAMMANGEGWLPDGLRASLSVVPCLGYTHQTRYTLPVAPSPNLKTMHAIYLYPSMCYFEATDVSLGRGTDMPFEVYGHPRMTGRDFEFTPQPMPGATNPPQRGKLCHGVDLRGLDDEYIISRGVDLTYLIDAYRDLGGDAFFTSFFEKLIGDGSVRAQIAAGESADHIKASWQPAIDQYRALRAKYLLYPE